MQRRVRTFYLKRQNYRIAANVATVLGGVVGVIVMMIFWSAEPAEWLGRNFLISLMMATIIFAIVPRLITQAFWRVQWRRHREEWG